MRNCALRFFIGLALLASCHVPPVLARDGAARPKEAWELRRDEIAALRAQAKQIRTDSLVTYNAESDKCRGLTLSASACVERANRKRIETDKAAVVLEQRVQTLKKTNRKSVQEAKQANEEERAKSQSSASQKQDAREQIRREKTRLQLEKLRNGNG